MKKTNLQKFIDFTNNSQIEIELYVRVNDEITWDRTYIDTYEMLKDIGDGRMLEKAIDYELEAQYEDSK